MSSILEQPKQYPPQDACTSHNPNVFGSNHGELPSPSQIENEYHALATQTANLGLEDQDDEPTLSSKDDKDTWSDEDAPPETIYENSEPQPMHATDTTLADGMQADQNKTSEDVKPADDATTPKDANPKDDETNTPRFQTYVKLHNDASIPFKSTSTTRNPH